MRHFSRISFLLLSLLLCLSLFSCGEKDTVLKIGSHSVSFDEYRYFYMNCYATAADAKAAHEEAVAILRDNYAMVDMAKGYKLPTDFPDDVDAKIAEAKYQYGTDAAYEAGLQANHLTEQVFRDALNLNFIKAVLFDHMANEYNNIIPSDDATVEADIQKNFYHAAHIFIPKNENGTAEEKRAAMEDLLAQLESGADFDVLAAAQSEEETAGEYEFYFTSGQLILTFEEAVKKLEIGQISGIVESSVGYHIIKRLPMVESQIDERFEDLRYNYQVRVFHEMVDAKAAELTVTETELFKAVKHEDIAAGTVPKQ